MPKNKQPAIARFELTCRKCGHIWIPEPNKWRNLHSITNGEGKKIRCPECQKKIRLNRYHTEMLIRQSQGYSIVPKDQWYRKRVGDGRKTHNLRD